MNGNGNFHNSKQYFSETITKEINRILNLVKTFFALRNSKCLVWLLSSRTTTTLPRNRWMQDGGGALMTRCCCLKLINEFYRPWSMSWVLVLFVKGMRRVGASWTGLFQLLGFQDVEQICRVVCGSSSTIQSKNRITPWLVGETKRGIISHQCSMEVVFGGHESLAGRRMVWRRIRKWSSSQIGVLFNRPIVVKHCHWVGGHLN